MSESLQDRILRHEGFCDFPKPDAKGFFVIGIGHDITKAECDNYPNGITYADALALLETDIALCKRYMSINMPWSLGLDELRQEILTEMIFQLGIAAVMKFSKMIAAIRDNDFATAAKEMLNSEWHDETPGRCKELANMMLTGEGT